jgi:hypothetical protein
MVHGRWRRSVAGQEILRSAPQALQWARIVGASLRKSSEELMPFNLPQGFWGEVRA